MRRLFFASVILAGLAGMLLSTSSGAFAVTVPDGALKYRRDLIRNVRVVFGMNGPVAVMAAQVHQESAWRPDAESPFAKGLGQFTPDTAEWISGAYSRELADAEPLNPSWALRALVRYDFHLKERVPEQSPCDAWAFTLAAYNGGYGWIRRDQRLAELAGADPERWFNNVERFSNRADWAFRENRDYPRRILLLIQPAYAAWGAGVDCDSANAG